MKKVWGINRRCGCEGKGGVGWYGILVCTDG